MEMDRDSTDGDADSPFGCSNSGDEHSATLVDQVMYIIRKKKVFVTEFCSTRFLSVQLPLVPFPLDVKLVYTILKLPDLS